MQGAPADKAARPTSDRDDERTAILTRRARLVTAERNWPYANQTGPAPRDGAGPRPRRAPPPRAASDARAGAGEGAWTHYTGHVRLEKAGP